MKDVDFGRLSEQYAGFLVAVGGVSITVLTLILGVSKEATPAQSEARFFLVAALIVAAVCCFVGAHMMAETSAFFSHLKENLPRCRPLDRILLGQRLFVLATANIFIGITLVLFAVVLLPTAVGSELAGFDLISGAVFVSVAVGALVWMVLAALDRTVAVGRDAWWALAAAVLLGTVGGVLCSCLSIYHLPRVIFIFIVLFIFISVIYFAIAFKSGRACSRTVCCVEITFFGAAITFSNVSLIVAYFKIVGDWSRGGNEVLYRLFDIGPITTNNLFTVVQIVVVAFGFFFSWRSLKAALASVKLTERNVALAADNAKAQLVNQMVVQGRDPQYKVMEVDYSNPVEAGKKIDQYSGMIIAYYSSCFELRSILNLPENIVSLLDRELKSLMAEPSIQNRWKAVRSFHSVEFQEHVDNL